MRSLLLRRVVSGIGLFVALATALSFPAWFATVSYFNQSDALAFKARLSAGRIARHVAVHGSLAASDRARLAELIDVTDGTDDRVRLRVLASEGEVILDDAPVPTPVLAQSMPIETSGAVVGHVLVEASLWPLLLQTGYVAMFSYALGCLAYFTIRILPLRVLDRALGELESANAQLRERNTELNQRDRELQAQSLRFETALENMSQGLCMFDGATRLIVCNRRYAELYELPPALTQPGTMLRHILEYRMAQGAWPEDDPQRHLEERLAIAAEGVSRHYLVELRNGRILAIAHEPMAEGGWVATHEDVTDQKRAEARITHMARHDALTGLPNRILLRERLSQALSQLKAGQKLAVLGLDLDHFKDVNDSLGHQVGDALLRAVTQRIQGCAGEADIVAHLGGDEFAVIQPATGQPAHATYLAARLIEALSAPFDVEGHEVVIGTTIGIAVAPDDGLDGDRLLKNADLALSRAKADGRGAYRFFESGMDARMQARRALEVELRQALAAKQFEVVYQPLVDARTEAVKGFEALLRWRHPERGLVPPDAFIPLAEEIGLIVPMGDWVLHQACLDAASWPAHLKVAVNLSPAQFETGSLVLSVASALGASGLAPHRLELEITETVMLQDTDATLTMLHQLKELGAAIAMDDFGTGYSSLSYLRKFPFDKIKIDQSFVRDLSSRADSIAIVRAVTSLGRSLGMATTAEGVETAEQLRLLRVEDCTEVQGYLFGAPKPASELPALWSTPARRTGAAA